MPAKGEKKKLKRKRGKKFEFKEKEKVIIQKTNPFEALAAKKYTKSQSYTQLKKDYKAGFSNNSSFFYDKRIGENSKNLTEEEKQKLRFRAHQIQNVKKKSSKFDILNSNNNDILTHKGKKITSLNVDDEASQEEEDDYQIDFAEEMLKSSNKDLSKKELLQQLIDKSKKERLEKKRERRETKDAIERLDEDFADISKLLIKRKRDIEIKNDDYNINISKYQYVEKTTPTDRLKTEEEIEKERKKKLKNLENNQSSSEEEQEEELQDKVTKKEMIGKMIEERLRKSKILEEKRLADKTISSSNIKSTKKKEEDDMSDLNNDNEAEEIEEEENDEGEEYEDDEEEDFEEENENEDCENEEEDHPNKFSGKNNIQKSKFENKNSNIHNNDENDKEEDYEEDEEYEGEEKYDEGEDEEDEELLNEVIKYKKQYEQKITQKEQISNKPKIIKNNRK